jgi:hypothetical protein
MEAKMKYFFLCMLLLVSLTACTTASSSNGGCSENGEVCVSISAEEPIQYGEPVILTITAISGKNLTNLGVSLYYDIDVVVEGPDSWENNLTETAIFNGGASWIVTAYANQPLTFMRKLQLPPHEGLFPIIVEASTTDLRAADSITIYITAQGGTILLSGTSIPNIVNPVPTMNPSLRQTMNARSTDTPFPTLTPLPTNTITPTSIAYPAPTSYSTVGPGFGPYP